MIDKIYEKIINKLELQQTGFETPPRVIISLDNLIAAIAEIKGIYYKEELQNFKNFQDSLQGIKDLKLNEFDEYEEIKD